MIRTTTLLLSLAMPLFGVEESPLDYVIDCLRIKANRGTVEASQGELSWPGIIDRSPTALAPWHGNTARVTLKLPADQVARFLAENGFKKDQTLELFKGVKSLEALVAGSHPCYSVWMELPRLGSVEITAFLNTEDSGSPRLEMWVTQFTAFFIRPQAQEAEGSAAEETAVRPESRSEGGDKPQPASERHSR
jgi:hypothetical protein